MVAELDLRPHAMPETPNGNQPLFSQIILVPSFLGRTISEANIPSIFQGRETSTEREIVSDAKAGDDQAQACIYVAYHDKVALYILARTGRVETAEDLTGDAMGKVLKNIGCFEFREGIEFSSWVFRIAHNCVASFYRKMGRQGKELLVSLTDDVDHEHLTAMHKDDIELQAIGKLLYESAVSKIKELPERQRQAVHLRFVMGLSVARTAEEMVTNKGNVKALQHKGIARLKKFLIESPTTELSQTPLLVSAQKSA